MAGKNKTKKIGGNPSVELNWINKCLIIVCIIILILYFSQNIPTIQITIISPGQKIHKQIEKEPEPKREEKKEVKQYPKKMDMNIPTIKPEEKIITTPVGPSRMGLNSTEEYQPNYLVDI